MVVYTNASPNSSFADGQIRPYADIDPAIYPILWKHWFRVKPLCPIDPVAAEAIAEHGIIIDTQRGTPYASGGGWP